VRERTSRRQAAIPAVFLLAALVLAILTAERGEAALPGEQQPTLSVGDVMVTEGTGGTTNAVFRVRLSAASSAPVTVSYATSDGGATTPADYAARSSALSFAPGETEKPVSVPIVSDALDEVHENFSFDLSGAAGATLADAHAFGTVVDDDPQPALTVSDASVGEGQTASFTVALSAASGKLVTVSYATSDGSASAPGDYAAASGSLTFWAGQREKTVTVSTQQDSLVEGDETLFVSLSQAVNAALGDAQGLGTIRDDDLPPDPPAPPPPLADEDPPGGDDPSDDSSDDDDDASNGDAELASPPNSAPDCSRVQSNAPRLWPVNHKLRVVTLAGATDPDGDAVTLAVTGVTQDERVRANRGDKGPDAAWVAGRPHQVKLRAERSGRGDGRVYRLAFTATDELGAECSGTALVGVPHDSRRRWLDSGAVYDSFRP
jgi:hypothetical protein